MLIAADTTPADRLSSKPLRESGNRPGLPLNHPKRGTIHDPDQKPAAAEPRRPGELGVHSVDHFNFVVPDLKLAQTFYTDFGLDVREEGDGLGLYTAGHDHRWGRVGEGRSKKLTYLSFGAYPEDFEGLRARLKQNGVQQLDPPPGFESNGVWFRDPDGTLVEIRVAEKSSPNEKAVQHNPSARPACRARTPAPRRRSSARAGWPTC